MACCRLSPLFLLTTQQPTRQTLRSFPFCKQGNLHRAVGPLSPGHTASGSFIEHCCSHFLPRAESPACHALPACAGSSKPRESADSSRKPPWIASASDDAFSPPTTPTPCFSWSAAAPTSVAGAVSQPGHPGCMLLAAPPGRISSCCLLLSWSPRARDKKPRGC